MKRGILIISLGLALTACGKGPTLDLGQFKPYVDDFVAKSQLVGAPVTVTNLRIQFGQMESPQENGACEIAGDATPSITINETAWDSMTESDRQALMFHELGHCVLRRNHVTTIGSDGIPTSMMYPYRLPTQVYVQNENLYWNELFHHQADF